MVPFELNIPIAGESRLGRSIMINVKRIGHATFETPDLDRQIAYYTDVVGLVLAERVNGHAYLTTKQTNALADWVASKGRNLTTIYITHGHGDHWFGVATLLERFPGAKVVATHNTIQVMGQNASPEALNGAWKPGFPGQIPDKLVIAEELKGNVIYLEGHELVAVELGIRTRISRPVCMSLRSGSWSQAMPPTMMFTSILPSRISSGDRNGLPRSTKWSRLTHAPL